ncbi:acyl carrier protein [Kitasatospora sp. NPDC059571]|uniref:acyl carrier protein n=1 Tax=Kitasatospora sp. NPDC059571 TaxID=3346871 RepID=UPI0036CC757C
MSVETTTPAAGAIAGPGAGPGAGPAAGVDAEGVVAIFRRVLETTDVTADSDFFLLGGDSLIATRVLSAIARGHGVELSFDDFLRDPTPAGLARTVAAAR